MLGFGALGQFALGEGPTQTNNFIGGGNAHLVRKAGISAAVIASTFGGFVAPPQPAQAGPFSQSVQPLRLDRIKIPDQQPSPLFDLEPPPPPPFTGFSQFTDTWRVKPVNIAAFQPVSFVPPPVIPDTHDGVWVKRKKRRSGPEPIELELEEKAKRRAALELAIYGPEVEYSEPPTAFAAPPPLPPDVAELARVMAAAQAAHHQAIRGQQDMDEESELEAILREIL